MFLFTRTFGGGSNPIFPQDTPKFGFGDGQKWGKSIWKEREKVYGKRGKKYSFFLLKSLFTKKSKQGIHDDLIDEIW